jgi:hypothetical protein
MRRKHCLVVCDLSDSRQSVRRRTTTSPCLWAKTGPTQVKQLSGTPLWSRPLALPTNIRLGWKSLPGTNTLAYYENP